MPSAPVEFSYQYSALLTNGPNKKYVKKERKKGYQVVAVRLKNNTSTDLNFSRDLELTFADRPVVPVSSLQAADDLKQGVAIYLLYVFGIGRIGGSVDPYTGQTTGGTILPWGPVAAAGNMLGASAANKNLKMEFARYDLTNKVLHPGETVYGIMSLRESNVAPLRLTLRNQAAMTAPAAPPTPATLPQVAPATPPATSPAPAGSGR
ncbi:hypothetical protein [Hymenobacter sp. 5414T-23]|uniref:hypothetical protein n=1 Tax=Hymenobacter sp. 5414T-23 TaxID=2932252 RepID=UPI001FD0D0EB|nr:hypothetical protein [Hymenobacter sp. 5414T-23]UOQ82793.1 hypothetical protein MUN83_08540 [Hymenobacter sp. 5414T-23]